MGAKAYLNPYEFLFQKLELIESKLDQISNSNNTNQNIEWLNTNQAAKHLNTSIQTIRRLVVAGEIESSKIGRKLRFKKSDLDEYLSNDYK